MISNLVDKDIYLWGLKNTKESIKELENAISRGIYWIFLESFEDVRFLWVEGDTLVSVYVKWDFKGYIDRELWEKLTDYYERENTEGKTEESWKSVVLEIQPKTIDNEVVVVAVKR